MNPLSDVMYQEECKEKGKGVWDLEEFKYDILQKEHLKKGSPLYNNVKCDFT